MNVDVNVDVDELCTAAHSKSKETSAAITVSQDQRRSKEIRSHRLQHLRKHNYVQLLIYSQGCTTMGAGRSHRGACKKHKVT